MLYQRHGFPEEDEIVLCKVTQIFPNSVFVSLLEYGKPGMVHISEIAPGRIRNLRDYVSEGREIICKVLRLDREKGHIDLSLRRVSSHQRQEKLEEIKQELKAETLVKNIAKKLNLPLEKVYGKIAGSVLKEYPYLYLCFSDIVAGTASLEKMGVDKELAREFTALILDKFKPEKVYLQGEISLRTYAPDGVGKVRKTLQAVQQISPALRLSYLGGGKYRLVIEDTEYKPAEKKWQKVEEQLQQFNDKLSAASLVRVGG